MANLLRFAVLIPLIFSLVAFVLTNLALFAGHQKGFMEEYAVIRVCQAQPPPTQSSSLNKLC